MDGSVLNPITRNGFRLETFRTLIITVDINTTRSLQVETIDSSYGFTVQSGKVRHAISRLYPEILAF